jgi:hypothetical protein
MAGARVRRIALIFVLAFAGFTEMRAHAHGGGLNACGCHFNRKTGECHCHQNWGCGCECQEKSCDVKTKPRKPPKTK